MSLSRQGLLAIALLGALGLYHMVTSHRIDDADRRVAVAEAHLHSLQGELAAQIGSERIVTQYVDRVRIVHATGQTILQKVPVYVPASADTACTVPAGFVRLHDAAAQSVMPSPAGPADAQASGLALSTVAGTVVDNYTTCHAIAEQLTALQDWARINSGVSP